MRLVIVHLQMLKCYATQQNTDINKAYQMKATVSFADEEGNAMNTIVGPGGYTQ